MTTTMQAKTGSRLVLWAETAADLMTPNPVSLRGDATIAEGLALLTDRGISAAPVIDEAGRPVGVLSRSDLLIHNRETETPGNAPRLARDVMTPAVFSVTLGTPAHKVIEQMLALNVHRLFVVDESTVLVGVVTATDILRRVEPVGVGDR